MIQTSSSKNLRVRSTGGKSPIISSPSPKKKFDHKKQIQATLNELHQLQAEIYNLNIPENPHSSGPIKKQIKQLSYLYESMTKTKVKNKLNVQKKNINNAIKVMNDGLTAIQIKVNQKSPPKRIKQSQNKAVQISLLKEFAVVSKLEQQEQQSSRNKISAKNLKHMMKQLFQTDFDLSLVSESKSARVNELTADEIQKFINYNEHDQFDPLQEAYKCLLDERGKFSFRRFNQINQVLGLPKIKQLGTLQAALGIQQDDGLDFQTFKKILTEGEQLGFI